MQSTNIVIGRISGELKGEQRAALMVHTMNPRKILFMCSEFLADVAFASQAIRGNSIGFERSSAIHDPLLSSPSPY